MRMTLFIILAAAGLTAAAQEPADSITDEDPYLLLMGEADRAIEASDWNTAIARLSDVLAVTPDDAANAMVYYDLGICHSCAGNDSLALVNFDRTLQVAPRMTIAMNGKGRQLLKMNRDYEAYGMFEQAIEADSLNTEARYYHGMMALYGGKSDIAESDFAVLQGVAPYSTDTAIALSTLYALTGRDREAIPYLKQLIEEEPTPEFFASLAGCHLALGNLSEASATLADAMARYPGDPELYYYRAWLRRDEYRLDDARADAARAIELGASPARVNDLFR